MSYDKGTAQGITKIAPGIFAVESFREEMKTYQVDLNAATCSCHHFAKRLAGTNQDCKHMSAARAYRFAGLAEKAKTLPAPELEMLLSKYEAQGDLTIAVAIRSELQTRQEHAANQQQLKALFA